MRVLVDTNIIIPRENDWVVPSDVSTVLRLFANRGDTICVHPASIQELTSHKDHRRRAVTISKVESYPLIESPPDPFLDPVFQGTVGPPNDTNSEIDDRLLYSVVRNAVDLLVTNDQGILRKASAVGVNDRVLTVKDALFLLTQLLPETQSRHAPSAVRLEPLHSIDLRDEFFDSLRSDYDEFDAWFLRKARSGSRAWTCRATSGRLGAFMLLKDETEHVDLIGRRLARMRRVKISTLKVTRSGYRLGELLLKIAFEYAINNRIADLYLTMYPTDKDLLIALITRFGFEVAGENALGEHVYYKTTRPPIGLNDPRDVFVTYYPSYVDSLQVDKFVVPIQPKYHDRLFPSWTGEQLTLDFELEMLPEGNAITKAYLCNSRIAVLSPGAVVLFYRSHDASAVTSVGVVERVEKGMLTVDQVLSVAGGRIVYSEQEIWSIVKKPALLMLFRWHAHFPQPLSRDTLIELGVLNGPPQSIVRVSHEGYLRMKREGKLGDRITVS